MRQLPALLTVALLTAACSGTSPSTPAGETVALGTALTGTLAQTGSGSWAVDQTSLPAWLSVTPLSGSGDIRLTLTANRALSTPAAADLQRLSGQLRVTRTDSAAKTSRSVVWTVTADQYSVTGRVTDTAQVQGSDVGTGRPPSLQAQGRPEARGVIVKYRAAAAGGKGTLSRAAQALSRETRARLGQVVPEQLGEQTVHLAVADIGNALAALRQDPSVEYAVPNAVLHAQALPSQALAQPVVPTDQYAGLQWAYRLLGYGAVWRDMEAGGYTRPVTVAVIDTGVRFDHPDLQGALYGPGEGALDVLASPSNGDGDGVDTDPTDPSTPGRSSGSHGTHVTGIIAARWGTFAPVEGCPACSTSGVVGASYRAPVKVLPVRVIDASGNAEVADVIAAVRYAAGLPVTLEGRVYTNPHPAQVINLSLGGAISSAEARPMCEAIADAAGAGALVVVAAGNGYGTSPYYPAACEGAVAVGAVTLAASGLPVHAAYSNSYPQVALAAPGGVDGSATFYNGGKLNGEPFPDEIFSTDWDYGKNQPMYRRNAGTSQAAPQVSALAALLLSKGVTQNRADTLARLQATATDLGAPGRDNETGAGMINAAAALAAPAVSDTLGLRVEDRRGHAFRPPLDPLGRFTAYLPDGTFRVIGGRDRDGNGIPGEVAEARAEAEVTLGPSRPAAALGDLHLTP